ncbi:MAG: hypothetical protein KDA87_25545, partial [Planctomycetales bacterium]|nr:hypothetical protein [Planctomycetales bacterium]
FDNVFWCLEFDKFPPDRLIHPLEWPAKNSRPTTSSFRMGANQSISINTAAADATLWLSPEWIDFNERIALSVGSRPRETVTLAGSLDDMLEDVRTRVDRQHVFWLKVPLNTGRRK